MGAATAMKTETRIRNASELFRKPIKGSNYRRGEVYLVNLHGAYGSEQKGERPVLVIQNDIGNRFSSVLIVASITTQIQKAKLPTHVEIKAGTGGIERDSVIQLEQLRTIDKDRIIGDPVAYLDDDTMEKVNEALKISLALVDLSNL